ncbi:MAG: flagellin [Gammaproteobacteria bacterium]|nr:flagellin [Gammaproteobacteria bacterium]
MATINTNMAANIASNSMTRNERSMSATMERLSTGLRINSAKDDAAGLAISSKMTSQIRGLNQAVRNANDAISMIQVAEGAMKEVTNMYQRMRELAIQAISDSNTASDRTALNDEYKQLSYEIQRIGENTQWNGTNILDGDQTSTTFQVGANASQTIAVNFGDLSAGTTASTVIAAESSSADTDATTTITLSGDVSVGDQLSFKIDKLDANGNAQYFSYAIDTQDKADDINTTTQDIASGVLGSTYTATSGTATVTATTTARQITVTIPHTDGSTGDGITASISDVVVTRGDHKDTAKSDILTSTSANSALSTLSTAIENVNSTRAGLGASMSRLEYASDNLQNVAQNTSSARSRVLDADYAAETTELARTQIIQQAATAMLAQANQSQQAVLSLLR